MIKRELSTTKDGSKTLYLPEWDEHFHSYNGARAESMHIFIGLGLDFKASEKKEVRILEMGYGTGLNAVLSWDYARKHQLAIHYVGIEKYPVTADEHKALTEDEEESLKQMHKILFKAPWEQQVDIDKDFTLCKKERDMLDMEEPEEFYDLIYMDAFDPELQAELWSEEQFRKMFAVLRSGGVLTTYSVKGWVKRNLKSAGFKIEKHPGPLGKREVLRAIKP